MTKQLSSREGKNWKSKAAAPGFIAIQSKFLNWEHPGEVQAAQPLHSPPVTLSSARGNPQHEKGVITASIAFSGLISLKSSSTRLVFSFRSLAQAHTVSSEQEKVSLSLILPAQRRCRSAYTALGPKQPSE